MCMFCAAIPAAVAIGAAANARQNNEKQQAAMHEETTKKPGVKANIPAGPATAIVVAGLVVGSVVYHTRF